MVPSHQKTEFFVLDFHYFSLFCRGGYFFVKIRRMGTKLWILRCHLDPGGYQKWHQNRPGATTNAPRCSPKRQKVGVGGVLWILVAASYVEYGHRDHSGVPQSRIRGSFWLIWEGFRGRHLDVFGHLWHIIFFWHACLLLTFFKDFGV